MTVLHILVVEDEPLIAMDLEMIIIGNVTATIVVEGSVAPPRRFCMKLSTLLFWMSM
jgi:hypothetical protein